MWTNVVPPAYVPRKFGPSAAELVVKADVNTFRLLCLLHGKLVQFCEFFDVTSCMHGVSGCITFHQNYIN